MFCPARSPKDSNQFGRGRNGRAHAARQGIDGVGGLIVCLHRVRCRHSFGIVCDGLYVSSKRQFWLGILATQWHSGGDGAYFTAAFFSNSMQLRKQPGAEALRAAVRMCFRLEQSQEI